VPATWKMQRKAATQYLQMEQASKVPIHKA
jgi:hypothetical protein